MERIRGTSDIPMTPEGALEVKESSKLLSSLGGVELIFHSSLGRCVETAQILHKFNKSATLIEDNRLLPWDQGKLQGMPKDEFSRAKISFYINQPSKKIPGGQSLDDWRMQFFPAISGIIFGASKRYKVAVVSHGSTVSFIYSWLIAGAPSTYLLCRPEIHHILPPGDIGYVDPLDPSTIERINRYTKSVLQTGSFLVRHGKTAWNGEQSE